MHGRIAVRLARRGVRGIVAGMILSRQRRYLFIHIPKTGGTAMALALEGRAARDDLMLGDTPKARQRRGRLKGVQTHGRLWKHSTLADLEGLVSVDEAADLFIFTLVRNPWDRAVSYYHWLREQTFDHPAVERARALPFDAFLRDPATRAAFRATPARSYVSTADGVERCAHFIRLERFEEDAGPLWDHLGFRLSLDRTNVSARDRDYRGYYSDDLARIVARDCEEDIARFGYAY